MNLLRCARSVYNVYFALYVFRNVTVQIIQFFEVLKSDFVITGLPASTDVQETFFGGLGEINVKIGRPCVFIIKIFIRLDVFDQFPGLGPFPKDKSRTDERPLVDARTLIAYGPEDSHLQSEYPFFGIVIKLFERPFVNRLLEHLEAPVFQEAQLGRLARAYVTIDHNLHLKLRLPFFKADVPIGIGAPHAASRNGIPSA